MVDEIKMRSKKSAEFSKRKNDKSFASDCTATQHRLTRWIAVHRLSAEKKPNVVYFLEVFENSDVGHYMFRLILEKILVRFFFFSGKLIIFKRSRRNFKTKNPLFSSTCMFDRRIRDQDETIILKQYMSHERLYN
jgi:hypothetical protein